jgi:putative NADH-flavin reductase
VIEALAHNDDVQLTLFLRNAKRLKRPPKQSTVVQGDVLNQQQLREAVVGQDIVYANLTGDDIDEQAEQIVRVMKATTVQRLVFIASLGIDDDLFGV